MRYQELAEVYERLAKTSKRLEKTYHISKLLRATPAEDLPTTLLLVQGKVFPNWDERKIGVAARLVLKSLSLATGSTQAQIEAHWKKTGDLGDTAEQLITKKSQNTLFSQDITAKKVCDNLRKLASLEGQGTVDQKVKLIAELLTSASGSEAKFIVRTVLEDMRIGVGEGAVRDAILWAFFPTVKGLFYRCASCRSVMPQSDACIECHAKHKGNFKDDRDSFSGNAGELILKEGADLRKQLAALDGCQSLASSDEKTAREAYAIMAAMVEDAYCVTNDYGEVAQIIKSQGIKGLQHVQLKPGRPIRVMLAQKVASMQEGFKTVGTPCAIEYKLDGFRMQVHKSGSSIDLFTRKLENVTKQFPEIAAFITEHVKADQCVLDCEAVGFDPLTKKYLPFQNISQRIRRKYGIKEMAERFPVEVDLFDILFLDGENLLRTPFAKRRETLARILKQPTPQRIVLVKQIVTEDEVTAQAFYKDSLAAGNEGIMLKSLDSPYKPGSRVGFMIKLKPIMETLDVVITGAEWGEGKRGKWLASFVIALRDEESGEFQEIGRVGTGFKELEESEGVTFEHMTQLLTPLIIGEQGKEVRVRPEIVMEISYEEIQKSPTYSSGYALRFPRLVRLREDRDAEEISTLAEAEQLFSHQRGRKEHGV